LIKDLVASVNVKKYGIGARAGARARAVIRLSGARAGADRNIYGSATLVFTARLYKDTRAKNTVCVGFSCEAQILIIGCLFLGWSLRYYRFSIFESQINKEPKFDIENSRYLSRPPI
jgi:hypothetical protein